MQTAPLQSSTRSRSMARVCDPVPVRGDPLRPCFTPIGLAAAPPSPPGGRTRMDLALVLALAPMLMLVLAVSVIARTHRRWRSWRRTLVMAGT